MLCVVQHQLSNMLTLHVRSRAFPTLEDAAQFIKAIIGMYDVYMENKRLKAAVAVANLIEVDSTAAAAKAAADAAVQHADVTVRTTVLCHMHDHFAVCRAFTCLYVVLSYIVTVQTLQHVSVRRQVNDSDCRL